MKWISVIASVVLVSTNLYAFNLGDEYIQLGNDIKNANNLSSQQTQKLKDLLDEAENVMIGNVSSGGFTCITGTLYGPDGKNLKWTGDSNACQNPMKVKLGKNYACADGYLFAADGQELKWTGYSDACGRPEKVSIGNQYACAGGYIFGPNNFEKWTGDSDGCNKVTLD